MDIQAVLRELTLDDKLDLITMSRAPGGLRTNTVPRLGIESMELFDGPHGVRQATDHIDEACFVGRGEDAASGKPTCYPSECAMAATWNTGLIEQLAERIAQECMYFGIDLLLAPGTNIKRTPVCGRNPEYFSEDPYLSGKLAAAYIRGLQKLGIGASVKHFAANNQEFERSFTSSEVDLRTLREIYCRPFEIAVREAHPWTVMCAYNRLNGIYCSENGYLIQQVLRESMGFDGAVISDFGAVHDRALSVKAGIDWEMPATERSEDSVKAAIEAGSLTVEEVDLCVRRVLELLEKVTQARKTARVPCDFAEHHDFCRQAAAESVTLLKHEGGVLPITKEKYNRITVVGQFASAPVTQATGSAYVRTDQVDIPLDEMKTILEGVEIDYQEAFFVHTHELAGSAVAVQGLYGAMCSAAQSDLTVLFAGNHEKQAGGEGRDRQTIRLEPNVEQAIVRLARQNPNLVVVLQAGSVIDMSAWINAVKGVVFAWYGGESGGGAVADVLCGRVNPSGKTAETFPLCIEDTPAYETYPGNGLSNWYREGLMVGYRYYDSYEKDVLFPFGHGLSYTAFTYTGLYIKEDSSGAEISFRLKNTGAVPGKEVCQVYAHECCSKVLRPEKELVAFKKVALAPGEEKTVSLKLEQTAFAYFNVSLGRWRTEGGRYKIMIGSSSRDIRLDGELVIEGDKSYS